MSEKSEFTRLSDNSPKKFLWWALAFSFFMHLAWMPVSVQQSIKEYVFNTETEEPLRIKIKTIERQQIVNNTNVGEEIEPEDAKFLSEKNQVFKEQKVARTIGTFQSAGQGVKDGEVAKEASSQAKKEIAEEKAKEVALAEAKKAAIRKKVSLSDLAVEARELVTLEEQYESPFKALGIEDGAPGETGLAQNNDFIEELPLGDVTQLNTQEYMYYGFYHRIRQRLEQHWGNTLQEKADYLFRTGGRIPASENLITALVVTMDHHGQIIDVKIKSTSGLNALDDAAVDSFNRAGPFPNPPEGMIVNGRVQIEWGFVVKS